MAVEDCIGCVTLHRRQVVEPVLKDSFRESNERGVYAELERCHENEVSVLWDVVCQRDMSLPMSLCLACPILAVDRLTLPKTSVL